jgi:hypothetical protein
MDLDPGCCRPSLSQSDRIARQALYPKGVILHTIINPGAAFGMIRQTCVRTGRAERVLRLPRGLRPISYGPRSKMTLRLLAGIDTVSARENR